MESSLEKKQRVIALMDCYEDLLTAKQQEYLVAYYNDDLSIGEIAEEFSVSRNAVFDMVKKAVKAMENYEEKLQLVAKHEQRMALIEKIEEHDQVDLTKMNQLLDMLKGI